VLIIELPDDELMLQYASGDAHAFDQLYARHKDAVYRYCRRQLLHGVVDDVHQEIWMAVINARQKYQARGQFKAWLFTLAHNVLLNRVRTEGKHPLTASDPEEMFSELASDQPAPYSAMEKELLHARLIRCIRDLPHQQRDALMLQHEGGFSVDDIAEITESSREGVRSRLRYAMGKLRERMNRTHTASDNHD
jgi:RNA polymerase sigma-70 factor, ECF subfamily